VPVAHLQLHGRVQGDFQAPGLLTVHGSGTYKLGGGTGKYAKASGSGTFVLHIWAVEAAILSAIARWHSRRPPTGRLLPCTGRSSPSRRQSRTTQARYGPAPLPVIAATAIVLAHPAVRASVVKIAGCHQPDPGRYPFSRPLIPVDRHRRPADAPGRLAAPPGP